MERAQKGPNDSFSWLEIGAGEGEFASLMSEQFPHAQGVAVDIHPCPESLIHAKNIEWKLCDINLDRFEMELPKADLVIAISILEHVRSPQKFLAALTSLVNPRGTLYIACPDYGSTARRLFRRLWPFFLPGEHLHVPSKKGITACLTKIVENRTPLQSSVFARSVYLPYTMRYLMWYLKLGRVARIFPSGFVVPLPAGVLEAGFVGS